MTNLQSDAIGLGQEREFEYDPRYFLQTAERSMKGDIVRALVELITNSDDSYGEIEIKESRTSGEIIISIQRKRQNGHTTITVADKAEGMELEEMVRKLSRVGSLTSKFMETRGARTRGLMGRGSKECVVFGALTFRSIKNNYYSELILKKPANFTPIDSRPANEFDRINLDIPRGNGTVVTLEVESSFKVPNHQFLVGNLPKYYSLRDICSSSQRKLKLIDLSKTKARQDRLLYASSEGDIEIDETFNVPGYPKAEAHLRIQKSLDRIKVEPNSPYWEGGVVIQSRHAIHGVTGFSRDIENNPYFEYYFGRLTCPYIDELAIEYEEQEREKIPHSQGNPSRIIDPLRSEGLANDHPFTVALYGETSRRIKLLLKRDEEAATNKIKEIENKKTKERLRKLADEASKFVRSQLENFEDPDDDNYLEDSEVPSGGMIIIPTGLKIPVGEAKNFYVYVKPTPQQTDRKIWLSTDSKEILLNSSVEGFIDRGNGTLCSSFSVMGVALINNAKIKVSWSGLEKPVSVSVVKKEQMHPQVKDFSFEKDKYKVRKGKHKEILILANWPEFVHGEVVCPIECDRKDFIDVSARKTRLKHIVYDDGSELAIGRVKIHGKEVGGPTIIKAILQGREIQTSVVVLPPKELGHNIDIKVVDEDLGDQRAVWDGTLLKISGRHNSIRRYLGPAPDFKNQDSIHFRLLLAELIADNVARIIMEKSAEKNIAEFEDLGVSGFYNKHRRYMNAFLEIAHKIQIPENEIAGSNL